MNKLQKALTLNAVFSSLSGLILMIANQRIAHEFGTGNNSVFWIIGSLLLFFSATITYEIFKLRKSGVIAIIVQDFLWVLGSIILIITNPFHITNTGIYSISIVAIIVLGMGLNQYKALMHYTKEHKKGIE
ncbi:hypothetical protein GCM10011344_45920 [Dokdonia pacifica]|uniref:SPW repeat-containing protein n=1 Tax=Dokdonia pacifica TaxID=1627892 RepID=A0A239DD61_9FLAO|nr:hypothetical protein [Dokdonia pacifica]GGG39895.1 hypothetical protein GCM10011344_45920 [Dokdonia pacifica]SNS30270.1 hypothetical protein SAMN06265376_110110 [Dokdonia pacifica]